MYHMVQAQNLPPLLPAHRPVGHQAERHRNRARRRRDEQAQHKTALLRLAPRNEAYMLRTAVVHLHRWLQVQLSSADRH
ncbi:hypothetical protein D3C81_1750870 [compost metagenome]